MADEVDLSRMVLRQHQYGRSAAFGFLPTSCLSPYSEARRSSAALLTVASGAAFLIMLALKPKVYTRALIFSSDSRFGRKSRGHALSVSILSSLTSDAQVLKAWPPRPWTRYMLQRRKSVLSFFDNVSRVHTVQVHRLYRTMESARRSRPLRI